MDTEIKCIQVGVKALLRNSKGEFLLLHRSSEKYPEVKSPWDIPGGRIEPGKDLFSNLKREVKEETSLDLKDGPVLMDAQDILRNPGQHVVRLTFTGEAEGDIQIDREENDEYRWVSEDEMRNMEGLNELLAEFLNKHTKLT